MWEDVLPVRNNYQVALMSSNLVMLSLVLSEPTFILSAWSAGMSVADMLLLAKYSWTVDSGIKHYPSINTHFVGCGDNQAGRLRQEPKPWDRHYCHHNTDDDTSQVLTTFVFDLAVPKSLTSFFLVTFYSKKRDSPMKPQNIKY